MKDNKRRHGSCVGAQWGEGGGCCVGFVFVDGRHGSHRVLVKDDRQRVWAYHEGVDPGGPAMAQIAKDYGNTLAELRKL